MKSSLAFLFIFGCAVIFCSTSALITRDGVPNGAWNGVIKGNTFAGQVLPPAPAPPSLPQIGGILDSSGHYVPGKNNQTIKNEKHFTYLD